jgi:hypothetical protein
MVIAISGKVARNSQDQAGRTQLDRGRQASRDLRRQDRQLVFLAEQDDRLFKVVGLEISRSPEHPEDAAAHQELEQRLRKGVEPRSPGVDEGRHSSPRRLPLVGENAEKGRSNPLTHP